MADSTKSNQELAAVCVAHFGTRLLWCEESGSFWLHDARRKIWEPADKRRFQSAVQRIIMQADPANRLTSGKLDDVCKMMFTPAEAQGRVVEEMAESHLSFSDCQLDLMTLEPCEYRIEHVALVGYDFPWSAVGSTPSPLFDKYLAETTLDEQGNVNEKMKLQLQEIAGFVLSSPWYDRKEKAFMFWGGGANGKSPFLDILTALVGKHRTSAVPLSKMTTDDTTLIGMIGKKLNANSEEESTKVSLSRLKQIISGEVIEGRRIYELPIKFRVRARSAFSTNEPPKFEGLDAATRRRFVVVPFERTVEENAQDQFLAQKIIKAELPAIIAWSLEGLKRLRSNNWTFTSSSQSDAALTEIENANNSSLDFLRSMWKKSETLFVESSLLYRQYSEWCKENNRKPMASNRFGRICAKQFGPSEFGKEGERTVRRYRAAPFDMPAPAQEEVKW